MNGTYSSMFFNEMNQTYRYYDEENDFEPIEYIWRTGVSRCTSTSSYGPHRSRDVHTTNCTQQ